MDDLDKQEHVLLDPHEAIPRPSVGRLRRQTGADFILQLPVEDGAADRLIMVSFAGADIGHDGARHDGRAGVLAVEFVNQCHGGIGRSPAVQT